MCWICWDFCGCTAGIFGDTGERKVSEIVIGLCLTCEVLVGCLFVCWICWAFYGLVPRGCNNTGKTGALSVIVDLFLLCTVFASI